MKRLDKDVGKIFTVMVGRVRVYCGRVQLFIIATRIFADLHSVDAIRNVHACSRSKTHFLFDIFHSSVGSRKNRLISLEFDRPGTSREVRMHIYVELISRPSQSFSRLYKKVRCARLSAEKLLRLTRFESHFRGFIVHIFLESCGFSLVQQAAT